MKQQKSFNVRMLLIAVLALLMAFALVACNGDKKNNENNSDNSDNVELSEGAKQVVEQSRSDFDAMLNYFLTCAEAGSDDEITFQVAYISDDYVGPVLSNCFLNLGDDDGFAVSVFKNEEDAINYSDGSIRIGNKLISDYSMYQKIIGSKRPSSITKFTKEQVEFMDSKLHRGVRSNEAYCHADFYANNVDDFGEVTYNCYMLNSNCKTSEGILKMNNSAVMEMIGGDEEFVSVNFTEDSYVRNDEPTGLTTFKLIDKPGWHISEILDYQHDDAPTGKYKAEYYYIEASSTITLPTKIGDYDIDEAILDPYYGDIDIIIESVTIAQAIKKVSLDGNIKEITIPLSDHPFVEIKSNAALETINFGGTMQQWEDLYGYKAQTWTHVDVYDHMTGESTYVDISFTVVCTNGSITYPKTNA